MSRIFLNDLLIPCFIYETKNFERERNVVDITYTSRVYNVVAHSLVKRACDTNI